MADFTVGKYLAARFEQIGLKHYFMVPGDYNLVLLDELLSNENLTQIGCCNELNAAYASELDRPLQIAMSLHAGPAVVGEMGYGSATSLTAVGDTLNTASRLEGLAKDVDAELVISDDLARLADLDLTGAEQQTLTIRGRSQPITAWIVRLPGEAEALP